MGLAHDRASQLHRLGRLLHFRASRGEGEPAGPARRDSKRPLRRDARAVRIEHGHPRYGEEITERYLVQETGQLHAVNFNKGCYLGQEIVERVRSRAQIHRLLQPMEIDTAAVPAPGTKLKSGDADAAEIASAVYSPGLGHVAAMAYIRVQFTQPGTELSWGGVPARVSPAPTP